MSKQDKSVQFATVQVERSYDMRTAAILHFNTARKDGKDLDDALDAAWRAMLSKSASPEQNDFDALRAENERLTMQLTACGVVALSNTPDSAAKARDMHPDYMSASCQDVMRVVDSEIALRAELAALKAVPDGVEVVTYASKGLPRFFSGNLAADNLAPDAFMPLMAVTQHNARMAEKDAQIEALRQPVADEREAFEAWRLARFRGGEERLKKCRNAPDVYYYIFEQEAWKVWKARAALSAPAAGQDFGALVEALEKAFPLLDDEGLSETVHHCEWAIQQDRKRLHRALAAHKAGGGV